ncbi:hypothetical protein SELMODRAFT_430750 [Selaginella moellendorffii]|uniref:Uncharacterized protein n=1 Tax=Selaginella moellendorffii TaxID=88036 RepID=D8TAE2_SELML|nr:hypothetical protein SELMODRAFT_430750 [Selaginella moellendorffii]
MESGWDKKTTLPSKIKAEKKRLPPRRTIKKEALVSLIASIAHPFFHVFDHRNTAVNPCEDEDDDPTFELCVVDRVDAFLHVLSLLEQRFTRFQSCRATAPPALIHAAPSDLSSCSVRTGLRLLMKIAGGSYERWICLWSHFHSGLSLLLDCVIELSQDGHLAEHKAWHTPIEYLAEKKSKSDNSSEKSCHVIITWLWDFSLGVDGPLWGAYNIHWNIELVVDMTKIHEQQTLLEKGSQLGKYKLLLRRKKLLLLKEMELEKELSKLIPWGGLTPECALKTKFIPTLAAAARGVFDDFAHSILSRGGKFPLADGSTITLPPARIKHHYGNSFPFTTMDMDKYVLTPSQNYPLVDAFGGEFEYLLQCRLLCGKEPIFLVVTPEGSSQMPYIKLKGGSLIQRRTWKHWHHLVLPRPETADAVHHYRLKLEEVMEDMGLAAEQGQPVFGEEEGACLKCGQSEGCDFELNNHMEGTYWSLAVGVEVCTTQTCEGSIKEVVKGL